MTVSIKFRVCGLSILMLVLVLGQLQFSACKAKNNAADTNESSSKYRIALVMKTLSNPFFVTMEQGARKAEKELGIELIVKTGMQERSIEQQIAIVDDLIKDKVDAIVIAPGGSVELVPIIKKAKDAGIKIVNIDNKLDTAACQKAGLSPIPFISVDNEEGAYLSAKFIADMVSSPVQAMIFEGIHTAENAQDRAKGAKRAFASNPNIKLVASQSANWKTDEAYNLAKKLFNQYPQVRLLFCSNDMMALGAIQFLKDSGNKNVLVAGYDNIQEIQPLLKDGSLKSSIDQQADKQGYMGVATALKLIKGEAVERNVTIPVRLIAGN